MEKSIITSKVNIADYTDEEYIQTINTMLGDFEKEGGMEELYNSLYKKKAHQIAV